MEAVGGAGMVKRATASSVQKEHLAERSVGVRLSEVLRSGIRLEASAYALDARKALVELKATGYHLRPLLGDDGMCLKGNNAFRFPRIYVGPDRGVPFLSSSDIIGLRPERGNYLSLKTPRLSELKVQPWDVLISCSGTIGNVSLASPRMAEWAVSQHVIRLTAADEDTAGFVAACLRSTWGRAQLTGMTYGSVVQHIEPQHMHHVFIPELPAIVRIEIGRAFVQAALKRDEANDKLDSADTLLKKSLALLPYQRASHGPIVSTAKASELRGRLDATFHDPSVRSLDAALQASGHRVVALSDSQLTKAVNGVTKFRKRVYVPTGGIPMLSSKQLFQIDPIEQKRLAKGAHENDLAEICLAENMVAITRSGTVGRVQIVPKYMDGWANSEHTIRVVPQNPIAAGYLYAWLASEYGQAIVGRYTYGSVIVEIDRFMVGEIPVPLLSQAKTEKIANLVLEANRLRDEAWKLEQDALALLRRHVSMHDSAEKIVAVVTKKQARSSAANK